MKFLKCNFFGQKIGVIFLTFCLFFSIFIEASFYYDESIKNNVLNNKLYTWLENSASKEIPEQHILFHELQKIIRVNQHPPLSNTTYDSEKILYTDDIWYCIGLAIHIPAENHLFHLHFAYPNDIKQEKIKIKNILKTCFENNIKYEVGITSACYSEDLFKILLILQECNSPITYYDIGPFFLSDPTQKKYVVLQKNAKFISKKLAVLQKKGIFVPCKNGMNILNKHTHVDFSSFFVFCCVAPLSFLLGCLAGNLVYNYRHRHHETIDI